MEQYEYLLGPKSAVGVKIAVHDPDEIPSMQRYGINVPVGRHTAIGIKKIKVRILSAGEIFTRLSLIQTPIRAIELKWGKKERQATYFPINRVISR